jgi:hypothetical protein
MRTKTFLLFCLFMGMGLTQLSAQVPDPPDNKNGTGTVTGYHEYEGYLLQAYCDGVLAEELEGTLYVHYQVHFKNGNFVWALHECSGEFISTSGSGEVFKVHDIPHKYDPNMEFQYESYNFIGNQGSHYVGKLAWNNITWELTIVKAMCPGDK